MPVVRAVAYRLRSVELLLVLVSYRPLARGIPKRARVLKAAPRGSTPSSWLVGALLASVFRPLASQAFQAYLQATEPRTPFSPKRMNLRGAVRVPLPPSEIDRVGAELSEMRGGLSRRDVGVALVVAGLGALTLAFT